MSLILFLLLVFHKIGMFFTACFCGFLFEVYVFVLNCDKNANLAVDGNTAACSVREPFVWALIYALDKWDHSCVFCSCVTVSCMLSHCRII